MGDMVFVVVEESTESLNMEIFEYKRKQLFKTSFKYYYFS